MKTKLLLTLLVLSVFSCKKNTDATSVDIEESAQQVGDVMASIDESGGSSGSLASYEKSMKKSFERYDLEAPANSSMIASLFATRAEAVSCFGNGFGSCGAAASGTHAITRNFNNCTVGTATLSGTVVITWGGTHNNCTMGLTPDVTSTITRVPNFVLTGRRGGTLTVTKSGTVGQRLTYVSGSGSNKVFSFSNDGINRKIDVNGTSLFDQTTIVTSPITITGTDRLNRVITGGSLRVTNNKNAVTCDYVPTNVTWASSTCNCPMSGSWSGTCSDGKTATLQITGCGTATYTEGSDTQSVSFDRCSSN